MNYNSYSFWILFALVYLIYWRVNHKRQNAVLLAASYIFYGAWDYRFLFLILLSTIIDYIGGLGVAGVQLSAGKLRRLGVLLVGSAALLTSHIGYAALASGLRTGGGHRWRAAIPHGWKDLAIPAAVALLTLTYGRMLPWLYRLPEAQRRKAFLTISMVANLAILGFFKYCDFFIVGARDLLGVFGLSPGWSTLNVILPAGISFYTFQAMSYTVDIYRGQAAPTENFADFSLFVCFFPHLVAGPIMRAHTLLPQVVNPRRDPRGTSQMTEGLILVVIGLFKKLVIADNLAPLANAIFFRYADGQAAGVTGWETLLGIYAFAFQIYGDFSGYSAIARGISKWLGFELVINFDRPYLAVSPSDFWQRWHISLSSWLRDYLYIPLGGNRHGVVQQYRNLMITMLLGGLWHGASLTFVAWGLYHGLILCLFRVLGISDRVKLDGTSRTFLRWSLRVFVMFHLTCLGWLLFRADSFAAAWAMLHRVLTGLHLPPQGMWLSPLLVELIIFGLVPYLLDLALEGERRLDRLWRAPWAVQTLTYAYVLAMILFLHAGQGHEFIYFQF